MSRSQLTLQERQAIRDSLNATRERRKLQTLKVFELKVNCHQTSKDIYDKFNFYFTQAKWIRNEMIYLSKSCQDIFKYEYLDHKNVMHLDKDRNQIFDTITLPSYLHRGIIQQVKQDIKNLSASKKHGNKIGGLKYKKECRCIPIISGGVKIKNNNTISIPGFSKLKVYGLRQITSLDNYELANANIVKKASGIYIHISVCIFKESRQQTYKSVGLDFGIKANIITSDGEKFNCNVQESEYLKYLQKQLHRKQKGSKRYYRLLNQIQKEYEHITNKKNDACNKLMHYLLNTYDIIYFQDEQISNWRKKNKRFHFGKTIQSSYLGRVKSKLVSLDNVRSFKIDKWQPTTKLCPECGTLNVLTLDDRIYNCSCGYECDRDIHAARNVKYIGVVKRNECLEQASAEALPSGFAKHFSKAKTSQRSENEDSNL